ncbi:MAG: DEAD/DEAH box helicase family protein [Candidatus Paceibacterota bacterium]
MKLTLPALKKIIWKKVGCKNIIQQLLNKEIKGDFEFVSPHRGYSIISNNGIQYCLTTNVEFTSENFEYILKTDKKATEERLTNGGINFKEWIKHPKLINHSNQDIIDSWGGKFNFIEETDNSNGLREPQIAALYSILSHLKVGEDIGTIVMPTGTGKTETMLATLTANKCQKLLVTVPSDALRNQIGNKFLELGLLKDFGILHSESLYPKVGLLKENFQSNEELIEFIENCNVLVTTMKLLSNNDSEALTLFDEYFSNIFIDEAHHIEASSWKKVRSVFDNDKVLQFTATPFRNDRKRLEGKVIFNFTLKKAQDQGYFKPINFIPIREYDFEKADKLISEKAVKILREDIANGYNHILMARCQNKIRAEKVLELYKEYEDLNPVLIHSSINGKNDILQSITNGDHKIIVAVNMLGEGFDLPQLKVAAFHDIRKSLPVTLQFAGRFTRTSMDDKLSNASFVANLADINTEEELSELYAQDSNWNALLSTISEDEIQEQIDFNDFINGFQHLENSKIPFQNIRFALSTVVYNNNEENKRFNLSRFKAGISNYDELEYKFHDLNPDENNLVLITADKVVVDWVNYKEVFGLEWKLTVIFYDDEQDLLFIHSSDKSSLYKDLANAILYDSAELVNQLNVFKSFYNINRVSLQNVGLKEFLNRKIRFTMRVGTDIEEALSLAEQQRGQKAFVFGSGYEEGDKITLGCSYKGRIWSYLRSDLKSFINWCKNIGRKIKDDSIDPNQVLRQTLIPKVVTEIPKIFPTHIDWDDNFYDSAESKISFNIDNREYGLYNCTIELINPTDNGVVDFEIITPSSSAKFRIELFIDNGPAEGAQFPDFRIVKTNNVNSEIILGNKIIDLATYLNENPVIIWFADGSTIQGNEYVELKQVIQPYPSDKLISWNWQEVDLSKEAQRINPLRRDSIQYKVIQRLHQGDYDIIYDDDYSGEIADVITIKETNNEIKVEFYHIKFAKDGLVNTRVDNFYEVCGQAQKSIHWKHKKGSEFFEHLLRRKVKARNGEGRSRLEKGTEDDLERLLVLAKNRKPMSFKVFIVQPSLSINNTSEPIMTLLGVTENYLKEVANIDLNVIVNE